MSNNKISFRYAKSLFDVVKANKTLEETIVAIYTFNKACNENRDLVLALKSPIITGTKKSNILKAVFTNFNSDLSNFMDMVILKKRAGNLQNIMKEFVNIYNAHNQILEAEVVSAIALSKDEIAQIIALLISKTGAKKINLTEKVNPAIIGGLIIKYGDLLMDSSISSEINNLKKALKIA